MKYLFINALIVNEGKIFQGMVAVNGPVIEKVLETNEKSFPGEFSGYEIIDCKGKLLIPGVIDDQVHFREPGLTHKADIFTESRAAVAGGITSYMEMPNTLPQTLNQQLLEEKFQIAGEKSLANFSFYMGASNDNLKEILRSDPKKTCGIKVFMGSSTGNMLVDNPTVLEAIFSESPCLVAVHCEDENTIRQNTRLFSEKYGDQIPIEMHPLIRSEEACFRSSSLAVELAEKHGTRLHVLHLSTAKEISLFNNNQPLREKNITSEVCVHHLWFSEEDYSRLGSLIKWNPAIKTENDRQSLLRGLIDNYIDVVATDHAPHTLEEKNRPYLQSPSGGPMVQHALVAMLEFYHKGILSLENIVTKMCHAPADCYRISRRGYLRPGFFADLVMVDLDSPWTVNSDNILYKCGWSPFNGYTFHSRVILTMINGTIVFQNGEINETFRGIPLEFDR